MPKREGYVQVNVQMNADDHALLLRCQDALAAQHVGLRVTRQDTIRAALIELAKYLDKLERDRRRQR